MFDQKSIRKAGLCVLAGALALSSAVAATADQRVTSYTRANAIEAYRATTPLKPRTGQGRVYALMVGIADYKGFSSNLPYTDQDAIKMSQTLERAGVLADSSIVLTNEQATIANVRAAFQRIAAQAGPNDTFLFFFSGHGSQTQSPASAIEPDARNETIVLVDAHLSDDEMAQMFRQLRAGTSIIALDSCFSGGFARDVVAVQGVMGVFASEEDLTSNVAFEFKAGGYLSVFLRNGLGGDADANSNGALTAGELSAYLHRQFADNVRDVESRTMDRKSNYQFLVIDRGGVGVDDLVWNLRG